MLAGARDHITPPAQALALADLVGTPRRRRCAAIWSTAGTSACSWAGPPLRDHWAPLFASLA